MRESIEAVVRFDGQSSYVISHTKYRFEHAEPPVVVTVEACERVAAEITNSPSRLDEAVDWARYLIGRRDVAFQPGAEDIVLDFLEDLAFSRAQSEIDASYLRTILTRINLRRSGW